MFQNHNCNIPLSILPRDLIAPQTGKTDASPSVQCLPPHRVLMFFLPSSPESRCFCPSNAGFKFPLPAPRHQRFSWPDTPGARRAQLSRKPPSRSAFALRTSGSLQHSSSALGPQLHRARASLGECKRSYVQHHCYLPSLARLLVFSLLSGSSLHCAVRHRPRRCQLQASASGLEARGSRGSLAGREYLNGMLTPASWCCSGSEFSAARRL